MVAGHDDAPAVSSAPEPSAAEPSAAPAAKRPVQKVKDVSAELQFYL